LLDIHTYPLYCVLASYYKSAGVNQFLLVLILACFSECQTRKYIPQSQNKVLLWSRFHYHPPRHKVFNPPSLHLSVSDCLSACVCLSLLSWCSYLTTESSISVFLPCTDQRMMQCKSESQCVQLQWQKMCSSQQLYRPPPPLLPHLAPTHYG
jgi:hypothetical protein